MIGQNENGQNDGALPVGSALRKSWWRVLGAFVLIVVACTGVSRMRAAGGGDIAVSGAEPSSFSNSDVVLQSHPNELRELNKQTAKKGGSKEVVLVTGITGMIGSYVAKALIESGKYQVYVCVCVCVCIGVYVCVCIRLCKCVRVCIGMLKG